MHVYCISNDSVQYVTVANARLSTHIHSQKLARVMDRLKDFEKQEKIILNIKVDSLMISSEEAARLLQDKTFPLHKEFNALFVSKANAQISQVVSEFIEAGEKFRIGIKSVPIRLFLMNLLAINRDGWQFTKIANFAGGTISVEAIKSKDVFDFDIITCDGSLLGGSSVITPAKNEDGKLQYNGPASTYHSALFSSNSRAFYIFQRCVSQKGDAPDASFQKGDGPPAYMSELDH